jgi:hypothetical protein
VIVPGKNDGEYLRETIETLEAIHPNIATLAVVPVGLTKHRSGLSVIRAYRDEEMGEVIDLVESYQERYLKSRGSRFVFASDEWYVGAGREAPEFDAYEGFPQLDNGVGSIRQFLHDLDEDLEGLDFRRPGRGAHCDRFLRPVYSSAAYSRPARAVTVAPELVRVANEFFAPGDVLGPWSGATSSTLRARGARPRSSRPTV